MIATRHAFDLSHAVQDLNYVRSYSIWQDLRILWLSGRRLLVHHEAEDRLVRWQDDPMQWP